MGTMQGKRGLVVGIANERSVASAVTACLAREGAHCLFTHLPGDKNASRVVRTLEGLGIQSPWLAAMDAGKDEDLDAVFGRIRSEFGSIDFLVHCIANADREWLQEGKFTPTPRQAYLHAMDISAWTFAGMAQRAVDLMPNGGSMVAFSYYGSEKAVPGYNSMGVAKAALESTMRYLAMELGPRKIRVNTISPGPLRTLSAMGVGGFSDILGWVEKKTPLRRNIEASEVGETAAFLLSERASGITGQNIYVDAGYSIMGL